jgi:hypothetical protein
MCECTTISIKMLFGDTLLFGDGMGRDADEPEDGSSMHATDHSGSILILTSVHGRQWFVHGGKRN